MILPIPDGLANALAASVAVATLLPFWRREAWWIRACAFPRAQMLALCLVALGAALLVSRPASVAGLARAATIAACAVVQALHVLPFTPVWRRQVADAGRGARPSVAILIANVLMHNRDAGALVSRVRELEPDLLLLVETDEWWRDAMAGLRAEYPHAIERPLDNTYGMLFYSRLRLRDPEVRHLVENDVPSVRCRIELPGGDEVTFIGLHPRPPVPHEATDTTQRDAELLLVARELHGTTGAAIVAGDLNDVAWSRTTRLFRRVSGLLDPRVGRGLFTTFPAHLPWLRMPLDHVFASAHFLLDRLHRPRSFGSDHLPIFARFVYEPGARPRQRPEAPDGDELDLAREKVEKAGRPLQRPD